MQSGLPLFLQANIALMILLAVMIGVRKFRRDRRELQLRGRRAALREALAVGGNELDRLVGDLRRDPNRAIDLVAVLTETAARGDQWSLAAIRRVSGRQGLDEVLRRRLRSRRPVTRGSAALLLGHLGSADAVIWLRPLLRDPDGDVKLVTAGALARIGTGQAAAALVGALRDPSMAPERLIERLGDEWAAPIVLAHLADEDEDDAFRRSLIRALGLAGHRPAEELLLALLVAPDVELRLSAARALATCGGRASVEPLLASLRDDAWEVRAQAATSLGVLRAHDTATALERCLGDHAWWVRSNAATALARLGAPGVAALRRAAAGSDSYAAERAIEALAAITYRTPSERAA